MATRITKAAGSLRINPPRDEAMNDERYNTNTQPAKGKLEADSSLNSSNSSSSLDRNAGDEGADDFPEALDPVTYYGLAGDIVKRPAAFRATTRSSPLLQGWRGLAPLALRQCDPPRALPSNEKELSDGHRECASLEARGL